MATAAKKTASKASAKAKTARKTVAKKKTVAKRTVKKTAASAKRKASVKKTAPKVDNKLDMAKAEDVARNVWFAGLGAYGRSYDELRTSYDKVNEQSQKFFKDLVVRGEKLQDEAEEALREQRETIEDRFSDARKSVDEIVEKIDLNGRIKQMFARIEELSDDLKKAV